tara:strand:- start:5837 stop:8422 length:2586 start_codon:yes stop_codon:yes gene_type:complete
MKPRNPREHLLIAKALGLLTEASSASQTVSVNTAIQNSVPTHQNRNKCTDLDRANQNPTTANQSKYKAAYDKDGVPAAAKKRENWASAPRRGSNVSAKLRINSITNADIGTFTEYYAVLYTAKALEASYPNAEIEMAANDPERNQAATSETDIMRCILEQSQRRVEIKKNSNGKFYMKQGHTQAIMDKYRLLGCQQGAVQVEKIESIIAEQGEGYTPSKIRILAVGASPSQQGMNSPGLLAQEDVQVIVQPEIQLNGTPVPDGLIAFSNKSGGSKAEQINMTLGSVGLCTAEDISAELAKPATKDSICNAAIAKFEQLNPDNQTNKCATTKGGTKDKSPIQYLQWVCEQKYATNKSNPEDENTGPTGNAAIRKLFDELTTKAFAPVAEDWMNLLSYKRGSEAKKRSLNAFSSCVTTVLGNEAAATISKLSGDSMKDSGAVFDTILWGKIIEEQSKSSVLGTLYPSIHQEVFGNKEGKTRQQLSQEILSKMQGTDGRYFAVNDSGDVTKQPKQARPFSAVHKGIRKMLQDVANGIGGGSFALLQSKSAQKQYFCYKDSSGNYFGFLTLSLRKGNTKSYSYTAATLYNVDEQLSPEELIQQAELAEEQSAGDIVGAVAVDGVADLSEEQPVADAAESETSAGSIDPNSTAASPTTLVDIEPINFSGLTSAAQSTSRIDRLEKRMSGRGSRARIKAANKIIDPNVDSGSRAKVLAFLKGPKSPEEQEAFLITFANICRELGYTPRGELGDHIKKLLGENRMTKYSLRSKLLIEEALADIPGLEDAIMSDPEAFSAMAAIVADEEGDAELADKLEGEEPAEAEEAPVEIPTEEQIASQEDLTPAEEAPQRVDENRWLRLAGLLKS